MFDKVVRVLVVDDMMTMRKIVTKALKEIGFTDISEASDGQKGWDLLNSSPPKPFGLIISDWNMPNCSGLDFLKRVRADSRFKATPFLLLTAESESHQVLEAVKAGVDGYIVKPFTAEVLTARLEETHKKVMSRAG